MTVQTTRTIAAVLALGGAWLVLSQDASAFPKTKDARPVYVKTLAHPDVALSSVVYHLTNLVPADARPFVRYFWFGATPDNRLVHDVTCFSAYLNKVNSLKLIYRPSPVPGTDYRLWAVDIRDLGWTVRAFSAVARRDKVFTEPNVDHYLAEKSRRLVGVAQDPVTYHAEAVVPGSWFLWTIMSPGESETTNYYDLLYANERFGPDVIEQPIDIPAAVQNVPATIPSEPLEPAKRPWPGGVWKADGQYYPAGAFVYQPIEEVEQWKKDHAAWLILKNAANAPANAKQVVEPNGLKLKKGVVLPPGVIIKGKPVKDFPTNLKEYQDRWGITANKEFVDKLGVFVDGGLVVAGSKSDPKHGSYVAYQDRVLRFTNGEFNNGGAGMSTQDFLRTSGRRNPANFPVESALGLLEEDAGEHLTTLPNGLQAAMLTGGAKDGRKRLENADARVAHSSLDPRDVVVWNNSSCVICHARSNGVLTPSNNKIKEAIARGVRLNFLSKFDELTVNSWLDIEEWRLEQIRTPYKIALAKATQLTPDTPPWNGTQFSEATINFIGWYNQPVDLVQASAELGVPPLVTLVALMHLLGLENAGNFDSKNLFFGWPVPRTVWDDDVLPELTKVIAVMRDVERPHPVVQMFAPELLRQNVVLTQKAGDKAVTSPSKSLKEKK